MAKGKLTPVMQQHAAAKQAYPDAVLFFRLGDFYEMFGDDAVLCARVLDLTLTSRNKDNPDESPMAGVPHHAAHAYIGRLLHAGYQVAICEQMADPKLVKGIVPREVVRVVTPGLVTADEHLKARENNWLAGVDISGDARQVAIALLDISTAELRVAAVIDVAALLVTLAQAAPREVLLGSEDPALYQAALESVVRKTVLREDPALLVEDEALALRGLENDAKLLSAAERRAACRVLRFARACNPREELPVRAIGRFEPSATLVIDPSAQRHLELVESNSGDRKATLLSVIDETLTPAGARLLRSRLLAPLTDVPSIRRRQDGVELFRVHAGVREQLRSALRGVNDMERVVSRVLLREASPKDLAALRDSLQASAQAVRLLSSLDDPAVEESLALSPDEDIVQDVEAELAAALVERPPALAKEGAIFQDSYDPQLSEYETTRKNGAELVVALETRLKDKTGISTLKVRYTRVFGWYLEVTKSALKKVPKDWRRKQTIANGERYTLDELDELAEKISLAEDLYRSRELELLRTLNETVRGAAQRVRALTAKVAAWDVAAALAAVAHRFDYARPEVHDGTALRIRDGRHPVVERLAAAGRFVPNDVSIDSETERMWIITGPNMAGKSTFLRQVALITILAQMGSFVPASSASIGVVDRVLSRVGASDDLARGESTFMVEMRETAQILRYATARSLVILDEIGRGTSTFDGLAIAWAVAEHLDTALRSRALFATHYHELTQMAAESEHVRNMSVSAKERDGEIAFLHRLIDGAASRSYGVAVAKLAGLPESVLARAAALLLAFEEQPTGGETVRVPLKPRKNLNQLDLFAAPSVPESRDQEVLATLRAVNVERLAPLDALQLMAQLKKRLS
ncbi:MAG: mismatch repair ATPase MutS [Pseudomonadota bacterium]|jgi:DNA mismatch repair protein MutS